ncbi:hypothetical protein BKA61DRAFT_274213 [Leptodontidium sp. MPI-SDFR-AT-0119]|nr:hypothetical protein BKA61DRAFT_274213 [Leptodontidium sp. MPI-SDFR-AT-0119]
MDLVEEYAPTLLTILSTLEPYTRAPLSTLHTLSTRLTPLLTPYLTSLLNTLHASPAILSLAAILLLLILTLQILLFVRRVMMFWFRMMVRLLFWGVVVLIVSVVWQRGVGRTGEDLGRWASEVGSVWEREYRRWEGYQNQNGAGGGAGSGSGKGYGGAYGGGRTNAGSSWR